MKICLTGLYCRPEFEKLINPKFVLESYVYFKPWEKKFVKECDLFLLDSGAFTYRKHANTDIDWKAYVKQYAEFIISQGIKHFFEVDIDNLIGYKETLKLRDMLEESVNRKCIPVWHPNRGKDEFLKICEEYDYVALGGIVGASKSQRVEYQARFPWFINEAHKRNSKIHGLGITSQTLLTKYHFDSVDSTSWQSGGRFGHIYQFKDGQLLVYSYKNKKTTHYRQVDLHNLREWLKYCEYANRKL